MQEELRWTPQHILHIRWQPTCNQVRVPTCMFRVESAVWECVCVEAAAQPQSWHRLHRLRLCHIPHAGVLKKLRVHCSHHSSHCYPEWVPFFPPYTYCLYCIHSYWAARADHQLSIRFHRWVRADYVMSRGALGCPWLAAGIGTSALWYRQIKLSFALVIFNIHRFPTHWYSCLYFWSSFKATEKQKHRNKWQYLIVFQ